jgi:hypothetical protein
MSDELKSRQSFSSKEAGALWVQILVTLTKGHGR